MEHHCDWHCWGMGLAWLLLATAFVKLAWNHVVSQVWKLKTLRYWQVLLVLVAIIMLCLPRMAYKKHMGCCHSEGKTCDHALKK